MMPCLRCGTRPLLIAVIVAALPASAVRAQGGDSLRLGDLQRRAEQVDPRAVQASLLSQQAALRRTNIAKERLPSVTGTATGQYLSDVPHLALPAAAAPAGPLNHQYDAYLTIRQPLLDPSRAPRAAVERARTEESAATLRSALFQQRMAVNDAFFTVLQQQAQQNALALAIADLTERRRVAELRVNNGAGLASEVWQFDAELLKRQQAADEANAAASAARDVLASLTGRAIAPTDVLVAPRTDNSPVPNVGRDRPEFAQLDRTRDLLARRSDALASQRLPRLSLVGRAGYGRPGINALGRDFDSYYVAGVQVDWSPWNWGATHREQQELALSADIVRSNDAQFAAALERAAASERTRLQALQRTLAADDSIVALRGRVLEETRRRFAEADISAADYIARLTDWQMAQLDRALRQLRVAEARARYFTTLGQEPR
jgi:outer membrane protein TolC